MTQNFLDPKNDYAFKRLFGREKNKNILIHFLNNILYKVARPAITAPIVKIKKFLPTILEAEIAARRTSIVDVLCEDELGRSFIIEMQVGNEIGFEKRAQYYAAKTYLAQRNKTGVKEYQDLKEVIFLAILMQYTLPDDDGDHECISHHHILNIHTQKRQLKDFSFSFIMLNKFHKKKNELTTLVDRWLYFFKHAEDTKKADISLLTGSDNALEQAYQELESASWTEDELRSYESVEMKQAADRAILAGAEAKGRVEGKAEGLVEGKIAVARNLLSRGLSINLIAEVTGFSEEEIAKL